jgi:hypothetical protein
MKPLICAVTYYFAIRYVIIIARNSTENASKCIVNNIYNQRRQ